MNMLFYDMSSCETENKVGGCQAGHVTDPWNKRMEEMSRRQRRMEVSFRGGQGCSTVDWWISFCVNNKKGGQGPDGTVAPPWMDIYPV